APESTIAEASVASSIRGPVLRARTARTRRATADTARSPQDALRWRSSATTADRHPPTRRASLHRRSRPTQPLRARQADRATPLSGAGPPAGRDRHSSTHVLLLA